MVQSICMFSGRKDPCAVHEDDVGRDEILPNLHVKADVGISLWTRITICRTSAHKLSFVPRRTERGHCMTTM